jgi:hypothetical protein
MIRLVLASLLALSAASAATCDRACLKTTLDQYLAAVVAHNPAAAPLSVGYRQTENSMVRRPGTGLWQTAKALGKLERRYFDTESGQAGYFGTLEETGGTAIATLRLKVEDRKITEAEWILSRKGDAGIGPQAGRQAAASFNDSDYLVAHAPPERVVPKGERLSRTDLAAITNSYFDGLSVHDGSIIMAHPGCVRLENGVLTTQRPVEGGTPTDCTGTGAMVNIFAVVALSYRRRRGRRGARSRSLPAQTGCCHAPQYVQRVVFHRAGEDPIDLLFDVLSRAGSDSPQLAALRRQLAGCAARSDR